MNAGSKFGIWWENKLVTGRRLRDWTAGFTLLELLVVIGVIGILASLVLPVLHRARENTRKAVCLNNLRQFSIAANLYGSDFTRLPMILNWLYAQTTTSHADVSSGQLYPYLKSRAVYLCPVKQAEIDPTPASTGVPRPDHSYSMNCEMCHAHDITACLTPAKTVFFVETTNFIDTVEGGLSGPSDVMSGPFMAGFPHHCRANFLMVDGHVQELTPKQMNSTATTAEFWYPNNEWDMVGTP
jgi:prepilin-type N-terminal cleavage/methylation domain-containing protein/prepilin-type processing-associated H-X9-DG protein